MNSRLYDLLDTFELKDRLITNPQSINEAKEINYKNVNFILKDKKRKALDFLSKALEG